MKSRRLYKAETPWSSRLALQQQRGRERPPPQAPAIRAPRPRAGLLSPCSPRLKLGPVSLADRVSFRKQICSALRDVPTYGLVCVSAVLANWPFRDVHAGITACSVKTFHRYFSVLFSKKIVSPIINLQVRDETDCSGGSIQL